MTVYSLGQKKTDNPFNYVNIMPYKLQNTEWAMHNSYGTVWTILTFDIIIPILNVLIYLKTFA